MRKFTVLILAALMVPGGIGYAKDEKTAEPNNLKPETTNRSDRKAHTGKNLLPIEVRTIGSEKKPSQAYSYDGKPLKTRKQLVEVIDALQDPEASRLLKGSSGKETAGTLFNIGGGFLAIGGLIYAVSAKPMTVSISQGPFGGPGPLSHSIAPDMTTAWILTGSGAVAELIGFIFTGSGAEDRRKAVDRYNHLVAPDQDLSMILLPYLNRPGLELTRRF